MEIIRSFLLQKDPDWSSISVGPSSSKSSRLVFNDEDAKKISTLFPLMITGKATIRRHEIQSSVEMNAPELLENVTLEQIVLRVRTEKRANDRRKNRKRKT